MTNMEFIAAQTELNLNNSQMAAALGISKKEIECYRAGEDKKWSRRPPRIVAKCISYLLEIKNLKQLMQTVSKAKNKTKTHHICSKCFELKPLSEFNMKGLNRANPSSYCKPCTKLINKTYQLKINALKPLGRKRGRPRKTPANPPE